MLRFRIVLKVPIAEFSLEFTLGIEGEYQIFSAFSAVRMHIFSFVSVSEHLFLGNYCHQNLVLEQNRPEKILVSN